jgi:hypothetical protein
LFELYAYAGALTEDLSYGGAKGLRALAAELWRNVAQRKRPRRQRKA